MKKLICLLLIHACIAGNVSAQFDTTSALYDFNFLSPGGLNGQNGWITTKWNTNIDIQVADTGYDGTKAVYFNQVGPGIGCDASKGLDSVIFPGFTFTSNGIYQLTFDVKRNYWGIDFGLAADLNQDGFVTKNDVNEKALILTSGSLNGEKITLPDGTVLNYAAGANSWTTYEISLSEINTLPGGRLMLRSKQTGTQVWDTVASNINAGLDTTLATKQNPFLWDMLFMHHEGGTAVLDNIILTRITPSSSTAIHADESLQPDIFYHGRMLTLRNMGSAYSIKTLHVFNMNGQVVFEADIEGKKSEATFRLLALQPGIYSCRVITENRIFYKKIILAN